MNKWKINPVLKKELMVGSRSIKMPLFVMGVNLFLTVIVTIALFIASANSESYDYNYVNSLFPILACVECGLLSLIVPVFTSNSISGERERQTLDIMLTTPMKPMQIVFGKLQNAVITTMMYMIATIPLLSISFLLGGMRWSSLIFFVIMMFYLGIYIGSVGVFCSSIVKKSVAATILTIVIGIAIMVATATVFGIWNGIIAYIGTMRFGVNYDHRIGASLIVMMFNPYSPFFDYLLRTLTTESIYTIWDDAGKSSLILQWIYQAWIPISMILNLAVAYGFLWLASKKLVITKTKRGKK